MNSEPMPDWKLPAGVDRGLWDYMRSGEMVAGYDAQMVESPLAQADVQFCEKAFATPGRLLDLGCGTGRLCRHFAVKGFECVGVDLSEEMLNVARAFFTSPPQSRGRGRRADAPSISTAGEGDVADAHQNAPSPGLETAGRGSDSDLSPAKPGERLKRSDSTNVEFLAANITELTGLVDQSFDYAACLFSTLGMVRGADQRARVIANAFRLLKPGGRLVLHVHNKWFRGLPWRNWGRGDITMPQAYAGAPLTLHHFARSEVRTLLNQASFKVLDVLPVGIKGGRATRPTGLNAYGFLFLAESRG